MKPRALIIGASLVACGLSVAGVVVQSRRLDVLRTEQQQLQLEIQKVNSIPAQPENQPVEKHPSTSPSSELLRLRNQVSLLSRRQRELAAVPAENEKIRARLAAARTNAVKALPAGYIRKSNARFAGYTTPEATVESMLWAMQHRDFPKVLASLSPEMAGEMRKGIEEGHTTIERIFDDAEKLPGLNVVGRNVTTNGLIELVIEIVPGEHTRTTRFRQINGEWKIDSESE